MQATSKILSMRILWFSELLQNNFDIYFNLHDGSSTAYTRETLLRTAHMLMCGILYLPRLCWASLRSIGNLETISVLDQTAIVGNITALDGCLL